MRLLLGRGALQLFRMKRGRGSSVVIAEDESPSFPLVGERDLSLSMKEPGKAPPLWAATWDAIMGWRAANPTAPVDTMGCDRLFRSQDAPVKRFHILVSLMLSPQSKDAKTKESMENLWREGPLTPQWVAAQSQEYLETLIRPSGLYRAKAKALIGTSKLLLEKHNGDVPQTNKELVALPGIGPKIAALALSSCWDIVDSIGCDVHVTRISQRLGWARGGANAPNDAESVRHDLEEWLPREFWRPINHGLVGFGQTICGARANCTQCPANHLCKSAFKVPQLGEGGQLKKKK